MSEDFGEYEQRKQSVDLMSDIMSAFDDIEEGRPVSKTTRLADGSTFVNDFAQVNLAETKNLLHSLQEVTGEYGNLHQEDAQYYDQGGYMDEHNDLDSIYGQYIPNDGEHFIEDPIQVRMRQVPTPNAPPQSHSEPVQQHRPYTPGLHWSIIEESVMGMKNAKVYSVKCNATNQIVLDNIMMYESAIALRNLLNAGKSLTDPKILGIISSGIQYTKVVKEAIEAAKQRQNVLKESRYDKAQELDVVIAEHKKKASDLRTKVLNFLKEEGFITK